MAAFSAEDVFRVGSWQRVKFRMERAGSKPEARTQPIEGRRNGFGFLRLLFASLVILSHTSELRYGDRSHEPLTLFAGTISFGDLAVDGFFIISGYLIVGSYLKRPNPWNYLVKRIARIYPAFAVASLVTVLIVAPLAGATSSDILAEGAKTIKRILFLQPPAVPGIFAGTAYPVLDGAMWTISYEFRCYLIVLLLGALGAFRRPWFIAALAVALLLAFEIVPETQWRLIDAKLSSNLLLGESGNGVRLTGIFLMGSLFYLWRDRISASAAQVVLAGIALIACMAIPALAEPAIATCGAYLIFAFAAWSHSGIFSRINNRDDISYGVYLYAWPIEKLILFYLPGIALVPAGLMTLALACLCGAVSWHLVEKPIMTWLGGRSSAGPRGTSRASTAIVASSDSDGIRPDALAPGTDGSARI